MKKVALIFGGSGGIGRAIFSRFQKNNITVYTTSYHEKDNLKQNVLYCDVKKNKDVEKVVSQILEKEGQLDIVINSVTPPLKLKPIDKLTEEEFKEDIETILLGGINIAKAVIPFLKSKKSGIIVNILSATVLGEGSSRMSSYVASKYGLLGFTKCLAVELAPFNISVFGISPSFVQTDLIKAFPAKLIEMEKNSRCERELIQPDDIAQIALEMVLEVEKYQSGENVEIK